ncbi:MAG: TMEM175 family protein [Sphingomicrobium sp.]
MTNDEDTSGDLSLDRLVFFSDAVFAIAITLLVLEIHVPSLPRQASTEAFQAALLNLFPSFFAFVLSFLVIGRFWMGHHERFAALRHFDHRLTWPNMLYLLTIAFMPFSTAFLGANLGGFVPALFYNMTMLAVATMAMIVSRRVRIISGADGEGGDGLDVVLAALVCVGLSFVAAPLSQWGMATIPLWTRLERRLISARSTVSRQGL